VGTTDAAAARLGAPIGAPGKAESGVNVDPTQWDAPFPLVVLALFVIVMARANATYWLGRLGAARAHRSRLASKMEAPGYQRAILRINTYGAPVVVMSFLTIGVQTLVNLAAGAIEMPLRRYLPAAIIGSALWALLYAAIGTVGLDLFQRLYGYSPVGAWLLAGAIVLGVAWFVVSQVRTSAAREE
jgi:membrane protein DedA with SNARE-associated domain